MNTYRKITAVIHPRGGKDRVLIPFDPTVIPYPHSNSLQQNLFSLLFLYSDHLNVCLQSPDASTDRRFTPGVCLEV
ncbi:hypothetical protein L1987_69864 [Smallanthus sonchifolius]|uniref:Uncharacterized protein n=1 Tax=Smallanthus sonchifolius TaxID=185202 RepID=A0ACB9B5X8_9ASTR|nr:hypothetical protein L1987_69864 [Smallanthus sonchifolius]